MADTLAFEGIGSLAGKIRQGSVSPVALTEELLARIDALDPRLHAFIAMARERALGQARAAESALRAGHDLGPLHGIPYAAKDLYDVAGLPTTAGTRVLKDNVAAADCAAVRRLSAAGMVLLGKTHTVQFAFGGVGINHDHGTPHNPWHQVPHAPGGSSSGSGVAVAAGLVPMALGTDTGGSVRIPAALCGIVGLKTTVGRISRAGVYPLSFTLDSVGPLTRSVEDAALVYQALQGPDFDDETTVGRAAFRGAGRLEARREGPSDRVRRDGLLRRRRRRGGQGRATGGPGVPRARRPRRQHGRAGGRGGHGRPAARAHGSGGGARGERPSAGQAPGRCSTRSSPRGWRRGGRFRRATISP